MLEVFDNNRRDLEQKTAWEPGIYLNQRYSIKNGEIDVESLWSVRPEIKNKFLWVMFIVNLRFSSFSFNMIKGFLKNLVRYIDKIDTETYFNNPSF